MNESSIEALLQLMRDLRHPDTGCAWDIEQDFASIAPYTIEEAYEVADAIDRGDLPDLCDELGDLLFQVVFHAQMAEEKGAFGFPDVVSGIISKMTRRHPHVFGNTTFASIDELKAHWEALKAEERQQKPGGTLSPKVAGLAATEETAEKPFEAIGSRDGLATSSAEGHATADSSEHSALDGVARNLPALVRAEKIQKRAARAGFDWPSLPPVYDKVQEELDEVLEAAEAGDPVAIRDEIGDLLFAAVNLARHHQVDAEFALREATAKFDRRFRSVERLAAERGLELPATGIEGLEELWSEIKLRQSGHG